jgi:hypothetical protein
MRTSDLHHERHELHRLVAALALVLCICVAGRAADASAATSPAVDLRLDFETGDGSQFSGFECPHPGTQFGVYDETSTSHPTPRQGRFAARFSETAADVWPGNDMVRCLGARYDSGESAGDDRYYALSVYIPATGLSDNLLWELHHPSSLYNLPGCGVAPLALVVRNGRLAFRIATGNCTVGSGYAYWQPGIELPGLQSLPRSTWVDVVMHVVFSEHDDGRVELWYRTGLGAFPALPQLARYGIPTLPRADSAGVHDVTLYTELGLYPGQLVTVDDLIRGCVTESANDAARTLAENLDARFGRNLQQLLRTDFLNNSTEILQRWQKDGDITSANCNTARQ